MNRQHAVLFGEVAPAILPLVQLGASEYYDMKKLNKKAEYDTEIAELQAQRTEGRPSRGATHERARQPEPEPAPEAHTEPSSDPNEVSVNVEPLLDGEQCEMCRAALEEIRDMEPDRRAVGLAEYGRMKQAIADNEDSDVVKEVIGESDVLEDAINASV